MTLRGRSLLLALASGLVHPAHDHLQEPTRPADSAANDDSHPGPSGQSEVWCATPAAAS